MAAVKNGPTKRQDTMEIKYRQLLTEPGEGLLLAGSAAALPYRFDEWMRITGLPEGRVSDSPLCAVPLPLYTEDLEGRPRQFSDVPASLLWHPLFWLPPRVSGKYSVPTLDGDDSYPESDDLRSARIAYELSASGLYDPDQGWVDILAAAGLDIEDDIDLARVVEWQEGAPDEILDAIDLEPYLLRKEDPHWALGVALPLLPLLKYASWAMLSDSLLTLVEEIEEEAPSQPLPAVRSALRSAAALASVQLNEVPTEGEAETAPEFWARIELEATHGHYAAGDEFVAGPVADAKAWLQLTRDSYRGYVDELRAVAA